MSFKLQESNADLFLEPKYRAVDLICLKQGPCAEFEVVSFFTIADHVEVDFYTGFWKPKFTEEGATFSFEPESMIGEDHRVHKLDFQLLFQNKPTLFREEDISLYCMRDCSIPIGKAIIQPGLHGFLYSHAPEDAEYIFGIYSRFDLKHLTQMIWDGVEHET